MGKILVPEVNEDRKQKLIDEALAKSADEDKSDLIKDIVEKSTGIRPRGVHIYAIRGRAGTITFGDSFQNATGRVSYRADEIDHLYKTLKPKRRYHCRDGSYWFQHVKKLPKTRRNRTPSKIIRVHPIIVEFDGLRTHTPYVSWFTRVNGEVYDVRVYARVDMLRKTVGFIAQSWDTLRDKTNGSHPYVLNDFIAHKKWSTPNVVDPYYFMLYDWGKNFSFVEAEKEWSET